MAFNPDPIALQIGPLEIRWYGVLISSAIIIGTFLAYRETERQGIDPDHLLNLVLWCVPAAFVGARLYYVIFQWEYYLANPSEIPAIWHGGLAIHGALIAALIVGYIYVRRHNLSFWQFADIAAPSLILGQAIGRWGNFFNQEAYGYPTDLPWAMYIAGEYRHPTFLYESLWDVGVFLFLLWFRRRPNLVKGDVFLAYIFFYSLGRGIIEALRTDSLMLGPIRVAQLVSLAAMITALAIFFSRRRQKI